MDGNATLTEADRINQRNEARTWQQKIVRWCRALPRRVRTYGPDILGTAGVVGVIAWEWRNSALGFEQLWRPGIWWASMGGAAVCALALWLHRVAMENGRAGKLWMATSAGVLAFLTACVVWIGVWSQLAADTLNAGDMKIEARQEREMIVTEVRMLERQLMTMPDPIGLEADKMALESLQTTARQWGLPDLDNSAGGDCDADLDLTRRGFCTQATDLRVEIKMSEDLSAAKASVSDKLTDARNRLLNFVEASGAEHFEEMAGMFGQREQWKLWANFGIMFISVILFVAAAFGNDYLAERRERKPEESA